MKKTVFVAFVALVALLATGCGGEIVEPDQTLVSYNPNEVSMCQVHMTFYNNYYPDEGTIWDSVHIKNGQSNSANITMTFNNTDIEAMEHTVSGQSKHNFKIWIPANTWVTINVEYKNTNNTWVPCPANPVKIFL